jgi:hypothetical protein
MALIASKLLQGYRDEGANPADDKDLGEMVVSFGGLGDKFELEPQLPIRSYTIQPTPLNLSSVYLRQDIGAASTQRHECAPYSADLKLDLRSLRRRQAMMQ